MNVLQVDGWNNATLPAPLGRGRTRRSHVHHFSPPPDTDPVCRWRYKRATHWTPPEISTLSGRAWRRTPLTPPPIIGELLLSQIVRVRASRSATLTQSMTSRANRNAMFMQDVGARAKRASFLAARLRAAGMRESILRQDLHAFAREGYRLFAVDLATGDETYIGFLPANGPLTLSDVAIADGDYEIRVRADGCYWRDARYATAFPMTIEGGEIAAPLPALTGLKYSRGESVLISWSWLASGGTQTPQDFALWTATSLPVDTSGEPDQVVPVLAPGGYSTTIPDSTETRHVAVRARRDGKTGPVSTITIPAPEIPVESPDNQTSWFENDR
jgi:hypothetical protein